MKGKKGSVFEWKPSKYNKVYREVCKKYSASEKKKEDDCNTYGTSCQRDCSTN